MPEQMEMMPQANMAAYPQDGITNQQPVCVTRLVFSFYEAIHAQPSLLIARLPPGPRDLERQF